MSRPPLSLWIWWEAECLGEGLGRVTLLKVTPKAIDLMLAQLGGALPRELTGRTCYRAWGIV
jgi:hypothetical protein